MNKLRTKGLLNTYCLIFCMQILLTPTALAQEPTAQDTTNSLRIQRPHPQSQFNRDQATLLLRGGIQKHSAGDDLEAEKDFQEALKLDPTNADVHFNLAAIEEGRGEIAAALEDYRATLKSSPGDQAALHAIIQLEEKKADQSTFHETPVLSGRAQESSLVSGASAFATEGAQNVALPHALSGNANIQTLNAKAEETKSAKSKGGTLRAFKHVGIFALKTAAVAASSSGSAYYRRGIGGQPVDTCACNTLTPQ